MARATTGGRTPVGGWRRSCRRLLPALLLLGASMPGTVLGANGSDAWQSARQVFEIQSVAIGQATLALADGGTDGEIRSLRRVVAAAVRELDALEVHDCFRVWWSYVRSSYVLFDQALVGAEANDVAHVQSALAASRYLAAMAQATAVDCETDTGPSLPATKSRSRDDLPLADAVPLYTG